MSKFFNNIESFDVSTRKKEESDAKVNRELVNSLESKIIATMQLCVTNHGVPTPIEDVTREEKILYRDPCPYFEEMILQLQNLGYDLSLKENVMCLAKKYLEDNPADLYG
jgi:hypothetical protein